MALRLPVGTPYTGLVANLYRVRRSQTFHSLISKSFFNIILIMDVGRVIKTMFRIDSILLHYSVYSVKDWRRNKGTRGRYILSSRVNLKWGHGSIAEAQRQKRRIPQLFPQGSLSIAYLSKGFHNTFCTNVVLKLILPRPKGTRSSRCTRLPPGSKNLSGLKHSGLDQRAGSRWMDQTETHTWKCKDYYLHLHLIILMNQFVILPIFWNIFWIVVEGDYRKLIDIFSFNLFAFSPLTFINRFSIDTVLLKYGPRAINPKGINTDYRNSSFEGIIIMVKLQHNALRLGFK